ncbi:SRPBCC family protein [Actinokineospora inagensis]|uniref:SRPBCC family protein n=1 Tax=Actinokineospora inagensis TaxID=103730 RepID=UPI0004099121|nr:ATPase [Actinokineospora inagensis]
MSKQFEIRREIVVEATPEQVFDAITVNNASWLFPVPWPSPDGAVDGTGSRVTAWNPPYEASVRAEGPDGWFNALEHIIEARDGGTTVVRYVHSGIFTDDWDTQYDGADKHTDFYLHSLGQFVKYFPGRACAYVAADGPAASKEAGSVDVLRRALGVTAVGDRVRVEVPGLDPIEAEVDYLEGQFVGLRSGDALYRFYCREPWGAPVSLAHHLFAQPADADKTGEAWQDWLNGVFA